MYHFFCENNFFKKNIVKTFFILIATVIFFTSCSQSIKSKPSTEEKIKISIEDKDWMTKFFQDFFLDESAIFTLWGTKPMTIVHSYHYTPEEMNAWINSFSEEEKKNLIYREKPYDLPENWEKWEKINSQYPIKKYLFFKRPHPTNSKIDEIFFVDILQTALTIERYHETFARITNEDFDALEIVFEIQDENSEFWKEVYNSAVLTGLLLGFGEKNAWCFHWRHLIDVDLVSEEVLEFADNLPHILPFNPKNYEKFNISHFAIPAFASFSSKGADDVVIKYQNEKKNIQKMYKNQDFLIYTLKRLMR